MPRRIVSYSEIDTAKQCALKHQLGYVDRWSKPHGPETALAKGTAWHQVMEAHYNTLMRLQKEQDSPNSFSGALLGLCRKAVESEMRRMPDDLAGLTEWMYSGYVAHWGTDPEWQILAVEHAAECRLPTLKGTPSSFWLKVKIDLVVRNRRNKKIYVVDHKSGKDLPGEKLLALDDQFGLYTWAMRQLGKRVFGQIYNAARTYRLQADVATPGATPLDERFRRLPMVRSDRELDIVARETYQLALARYTQQAAVSRAGAMSPRSTDPDRCAWRCDFRDACLAGRKGLNVQGFLRDQGFTQDFSRH
ncbi:MAG TPA: PD-(D/E)XK nuclease family protein [Trebonia sp.]|nr:PD-(D/E)XK nuclease family protein [Trebonia sp.]